MFPPDVDSLRVMLKQGTPVQLASYRPSRLAAYEDLFERLLDPSFLLDSETFRVLDTNLAGEQVLGESLEQIKGKPVLKWIAEEHLGEFSKDLRIARRRYYPRAFDAVWVTNSGKRILMEVVACILKLSNGSTVIQVIAKDVTSEREAKRKAAEYLEELKAANIKLEALSTTDEMTALSNYRNFKREAEKEHERAARYGTPYSIIFCDVDHFKHYNDRNGHPAGDEVLKGVARILVEQCRNTDLPARYGGEEFVVLCRGVSYEGATILAQRIRGAVEKNLFPAREHQPLGLLTISVGVAGFPNDGKDLEDVLKAADDALYYSKKNGRNRVTTSEQFRSLKGELEKAS